MRQKRLAVFAICLLFLLSCVLSAGASSLVTYPKFRGIDQNGVPLAGGFVRTYVVGSSTPKQVYSNPGCTVPLTQPIQLDSRGEAVIYSTSDLDIYLYDHNNVPIWGPIVWKASTGGGAVTADWSTITGKPDSYVGTDLDYADLPSAAAYFTANPTIYGAVHVTTNQTIGADLTIPANMTLKVHAGAIITVANTFTLTINGPFEAGIYQTFAWAGTGKVVCGLNIEYARPEWWGAAVGSASDQTAYIQAAASSCKRIKFSRGIYLCNLDLTALPTPLTGLSWEGEAYVDGTNGTNLKGYDDTKPIISGLFTVGTVQRYLQFKNLNLLQSGGSASTGNNLLDWAYILHVDLQNCQFINAGGWLSKLEYCEYLTFYDCKFYKGSAARGLGGVYAFNEANNITFIDGSFTGSGASDNTPGIKYGGPGGGLFIYGGDFNSWDIGIYIDSTYHIGNVQIESNFEQNNTCGIQAGTKDVSDVYYGLSGLRVRGSFQGTGSGHAILLYAKTLYDADIDMNIAVNLTAAIEVYSGSTYDNVYIKNGYRGSVPIPLFDGLTYTPFGVSFSHTDYPIYYVDDGNVDTLTNALDAARDSGPALVEVKGGTYTLSADYTAHSNTTLKIDRGAIIDPSTHTLTINGTLDAGPYKIFNYSDTGTVACGYKIPFAYIEWWGGLQGSSNNSTYIIQALKSCKHIKLLRGSYLINADITQVTNVNGIIIEGEGFGNGTDGTILSGYDSTAPIISGLFGSSGRYLQFKNLVFSQSGGGASTGNDLVTLQNAINVTFDHCYFQNAGGWLLQLASCYYTQLKECYFSKGSSSRGEGGIYASACQNLAIYGGTIQGSGSSETTPGIKFAGSAYGLSVDGTYFQSWGTGIWLDNTAGRVINTRIAGNFQLNNTADVQIGTKDVNNDPSISGVYVKGNYHGPSTPGGYTIELWGKNLYNIDLRPGYVTNRSAVFDIYSGCTHNHTTLWPGYIGAVPLINGTLLAGITRYDGIVLAGIATLSSGTSAITFTANEPDTNYRVLMNGDADENFYISSKAVGGFTINSSNGSSTANVSYRVER